MITLPKVDVATEYGNAASFWVEYPSGLIDLTRSSHLVQKTPADKDNDPAQIPPALDPETQFELEVDGAGTRTLRLNKAHTALVIIDMQKYVCALLWVPLQWSAVVLGVAY